jgi:hypothetical protein
MLPQESVACKIDVMHSPGGNVHPVMCYPLCGSPSAPAHRPGGAAQTQAMAVVAQKVAQGTLQCCTSAVNHGECFSNPLNMCAGAVRAECSLNSTQAHQAQQGEPGVRGWNQSRPALFLL